MIKTLFKNSGRWKHNPIRQTRPFSQNSFGSNKAFVSKYGFEKEDMFD